MMEPLYATPIAAAPAPPAPPAPDGGWLSRSAAAAYVGPRRAGRPTSPETIGDWMTKGCRGVRLRFQLRGCQNFTRVEWIDEFFAELTRRREDALPRVASGPSPRKLQQRYAAATERLKKKGLV